MPAVDDTPDALLVLAYEAGSSAPKALAAGRGLAERDLEADTQALLLRQLYLAQLQAGHYPMAAQTADHMVELGELALIARADAARAYAACGDFATAVRHQRLAARLAPASLRGVQYARLARMLRFLGDLRSVLPALRHAERWATSDRVLYRAEITLVRSEAGQEVALEAAYEALAAETSASPLTYYVGAELALRLGEQAVGLALFRDFVSRAQALPLVERVSLLAEYRRAESAAAPLFAKTPR